MKKKYSTSNKTPTPNLTSRKTILNCFAWQSQWERGKAAFTKPSRGTNEVRGERQSTETLSFRCWRERCRLTRGAAFTLAEGASHGAVSDSHRKAAFTLAEVLITLGIIGVVAAMTMPTLMSKYREEVTMNKLKKFYTTMAQVQLRSIADHGEVDAWDWVPSGGESNNQIVLNWYNKYFGQYLNDCKIIDRKVLKDNELVDGGITVQLSDGSVFNISGFAGEYLHFSYFTNYKTFMDETAVQGKDAFLFGFNTKTTLGACLKRFNGYICHRDENALKNDGWGGCYVKNPSHGSNVYCTRLLQINGWKVPKDYPFKF